MEGKRQKTPNQWRPSKHCRRRRYCSCCSCYRSPSISKSTEGEGERRNWTSRTRIPQLSWQLFEVNMHLFLLLLSLVSSPSASPPSLSEEAFLMRLFYYKYQCSFASPDSFTSLAFLLHHMRQHWDSRCTLSRFPFIFLVARDAHEHTRNKHK